MLKSIRVDECKYIVDETKTVPVRDPETFFEVEYQDELSDAFYDVRDQYLDLLKNKYTQDRPETITEFTVYFTSKCLGECPYCHQGSNDFKRSGDLSFEQFLKSLDEIESIAPIADDVYIRLTGGDIFLSRDYKKIIDYIVGRFPNSSIKLFLSLLNSEKIYEQDVKPLLERLKNHKVLVEFTFDIGVDGIYTRQSTKLGITKAVLLDRIRELVDTYYQDYHIDIKSLISLFTDPDLFRSELASLYDEFKDKAVFLFNIAKDKMYNPTDEIVDEVIAFISEDYLGESFPVMGKKVGIGRIEYDHDLKDHYCQVYISTATINDDGSIGNCFVRYQTDPVWYKLQNETDRDIFTNLADECHECNLIMTCNRCVYRRRIYPCSKFPFFKQWEEFLLILKVLYNFKKEIRS